MRKSKARSQGPVKPLITERVEKETRYSLTKDDVEVAIRRWLDVDDSFAVEFVLDGPFDDEQEFVGANVSKLETDNRVG